MTEQERLNEIIDRCLWEPGGDPNDDQLVNAADAYILLKQKGMEVDSEGSVIRVLRRDNVYEEDFLSEMDSPPDIPEYEDD